MNKVKQRPNRSSDRIKGKAVLQAVFGLILFTAICFFVVQCVSGRKDYQDFLDDLGARESSDRYDAQNRFGYLGRYQMGKLALIEAGFLDSEGNWTDLANSYGIYSESDFLESADGQDAAMKACHLKLCEYIRIYGLDAYVDTVYCGVRVTPSGLLAACHLVGAKSMKDALESGGMVYDGNHVSAAEYMKTFAGYDISDVWKA